MAPLLTDFVAFLGEHRDCATDMSGGVEDQADGARRAVIWLACEACGMKIVREV